MTSTIAAVAMMEAKFKDQQEIIERLNKSLVKTAIIAEQLRVELGELKAQNNNLISESYAYIAAQPLGRAHWVLELKKTPTQCLAQVKHDAIIEAIEDAAFDGSMPACTRDNLDNYATNILTQAKDNT